MVDIDKVCSIKSIGENVKLRLKAEVKEERGKGEKKNNRKKSRKEKIEKSRKRIRIKKNGKETEKSEMLNKNEGTKE